MHIDEMQTYANYDQNITMSAFHKLVTNEQTNTPVSGLAIYAKSPTSKPKCP